MNYDKLALAMVQVQESISLESEISNFNKIIESVNILNENGLLLEVDMKEVWGKIKEKIVSIFHTIIEKIKELAKKIFGRRNIKMPKKINENEVEYKDILFIYKNKQYRMEDVSSLLDLLAENIGLNNHLCNIVDNAISINPDQSSYDAYVEKYGEDVNEDAEAIEIKVTLQTMPIANYNFDERNKVYQKATERFGKEIDWCRDYFTRFADRIDNATPHINDMNQINYISKVYKTLVNKCKFYDTYLNKIGEKFILMAENSVSDQN